MNSKGASIEAKKVRSEDAVSTKRWRDPGVDAAAYGYTQDPWHPRHPSQLAA
jgi:hypothetical protein